MTYQKTLADRIYCFLDTNAMIHFQMFDEVDWLTILSASEVYLLLAPIVLKELDKHKLDSSNEWRQKRARTLISKLKGFQPGHPMKVKDNVFIEVLSKEPQIEWTTMGLDGQVNDDRLIASMICFREEDSARKIVFMAHDTMARLKAATHGIEAQDPEDSISAIERSSPEVAEIQRLNKKIADLETRIPKLNFGFWQDGGIANHIKLAFKDAKENATLDEEISQKVSEENAALQKIIDTAYRISRSPIRDFGRVSPIFHTSLLTFPIQEKAVHRHSSPERVIQRTTTKADSAMDR